MGPPGGLFGRKARIVGSCSPSWAPPGAVLEPSWAVLGPSWAVLGASWAVLERSWAVLGPLGGLLGRLGAVFGASRFVLERRKFEKARTPKTLENTMKINDVCLFGPSWGSSWSALGASLGPLGPSWRHLGPSWQLWWPPRSVLEAILGVLDAWESARDVSGRRQSLGKMGAMRATGCE